MKKLLTLTLTMMLAMVFTPLFAYTVFVKGVVQDGNGNPVANHAVLLETRTTYTPNNYSNLVYTDANGLFRDQFDVREGVTGVLTISTRSCLGTAIVQKFRFSSERTGIRTTITNCRPDCSVTIRKEMGPNWAKLYARPTGAGPFRYLWNTGATNEVIRVTQSGEYCVKITDSEGCQARTCIEVSFGPECAVKIAVRKSPQYPGVVFLHAQPRGSSPYRYSWSTGQSGQTIRVVNSGTYCVTMVDSEACKARDCVDIRTGGRLLGNEAEFTPMDSKPEFLVFPNPASNEVTLSSKSDLLSNYTVINIHGRTVKTGTIQGQSQDLINISDLDPGIYTIRITGLDFNESLNFFKQ